MALPLPQNTQVFSNDQRITFRAFYWDTTSTAIRLGPSHAEADQKTAFGSGVEFAIFDLLDSAFQPVDKASIEAALAPTSGKTNAVLGYDKLGKFRTGVVPNVYMYWGAGAPPGGSRSKQVLLKFSGYVRDNIDAATLILAGQGTVAAYVTRASGGATEQIIGISKIHEPEARVNLRNVTPTRIKDEWGYQFNSAPIALHKGDKVEIYYWHNGEPWGGIAAKLLPSGVTTNSDTFLSEVRSAPILSTSFMAVEPQALPALAVQYLSSAELKAHTNQVAELTLNVALTQRGEADGYFLDGFREEYNLKDNADITKVLKKGRVVHFEGGFVAPNGSDESYARFTGYIDDIFPSEDGSVAQITCRSFEGKLAEVFDQNNPDRLAYHAHGYILRERAGEPVFGIPAYDFWPIEVAIADLCYRAGIDAYNLGFAYSTLTPNFGKWRFLENSSQATYYGSRLFGARTLADDAKQILIERNANYGNVPPLQKDEMPRDDEYLFKPEVTQRHYDRIHTITDHYGYDFFFNPEGQCVLTGRNNPMYFQYLTRPGTYSPSIVDGQAQGVSVSAVGGIYHSKTDSDAAWSRVIEGRFSRADLYVGIGQNKATGLNGGKLNVTVEVSDGHGGWTTVTTNVISTYYNGKEGFYYTGLVRKDGTNAAVVKIMSLPLDHYRITITPAGPDQGQSHCIYRLNGAAIFERDPEQSYYNAGMGYQVLSTLGNTLSVNAQSNYKDLRNQVIVVGARKATVTDSVKINNETANPNNPEYEFQVAVAVDPFSIYDPTSANYVGMQRMTVIFDDKINDSEFARWATRTILLRSRMPKISANFTHTVLPTLELRDALYVVEERNKSVEHLLWAVGFTERWQVNDDGTVEATTQIDGVANPEIPSFQPREDIDIDTLFRRNPADPTSGVPVINVDITYRNIYGRMVDSSTLFNDTAIKGFTTRGPKNSKADSQPMRFVPITDAAQAVAPDPVIPETLYLGWNIGVGDSGMFGTPVMDFNLSPKRVLVNNPYRHFFYIDGWDATRRPTIKFQFEEGDGTAGVYDKSYYSFPNLGGMQWYMAYDYLPTRTGENPFYDPYTSELGNFVSIKFDALVSGRFRVSVWDANQAQGYPTPIAWLSQPQADPTQEDAHWVYMDAGEAREFVWDGVDNIGYWNVLQSVDWANEIAGSFGDRPNTVGKGFYAWNDASTNRHTLIGDNSSNNFDKNNTPYFTLGQFGQFFVKIEVLNDDLVRKDLRTTGQPNPRTVDSNDLPNAPTWNLKPKTFVWTHLSEPTQVAIRIQDWISTGTWSEGMITADTDWGAYSTPTDANASFKVGKPVRITFVPRARRGPLWEDKNGNPDPTVISGKLTRQAHLKATFFDQFWTLFGKTWQDFNAKIDIGGAEQKRLTSRMFHDENHTLEFEDTAWRTGAALQNFEWIFDPTQFEKDFGAGQSEKLRYGDYEQLQALPGFDPKRLGGTAAGTRAYLTMAFINYVMFFSAFFMDRSGRRQWCLNSYKDDQGRKTGFVDKTKIVTPNWLAASGNPTSPNYKKYAVIDYEPKGAERYLARSIFARQWIEPGWATGTYGGNPVTQWGITDAYQLKYTQFAVKNLSPESGYFVGGDSDAWLEEFAASDSDLNKRIDANSKELNKSPFRAINGVSMPTRTFAVPGFGTWNFDRPTVEGFFKPSPARDFHPYWVYPFMPDYAGRYLWPYTSEHANGQWNVLNVLQSTASQINFKVRDPAAQTSWYGYAFSDEYVAAVASVSLQAAKRLRGVKLERTVEELGALDPDKSKDSYSITDIAAMFDYAKQDQLDRFDQYRGVISRAPYPDRTADETDDYRDHNKKRASSIQPVKPAGVYLFNLGRYSDYTLAPIHRDLPNTRIHFTDMVGQFYDIRFQHEFVWYSPRYFPVTQHGGAIYSYTRDEFTKVSGYFGEPWWAKQGGKITFDINAITFDAGAWTGWKGDVPRSGSTVPTAGINSDWTNEPKLRWREVGANAYNILGALHVTATGGFSNPVANWSGVKSTGMAQQNIAWLNADASERDSLHTRYNIFDDYVTSTDYPRLAVGPEPAESVGLVMNLVLPKKLKG